MSKAAQAQPKPLADLFRLCLTAGSGLPGAPAFTMSLLVDPSGSSVSGVVQITQAIAPPNGDVRVNVTGTFHELVFGGNVTRVITLQGEYVVHCPPPALCLYLVDFTAHMVLDNSWNGAGTFTYGNDQSVNVPVKHTDC